MKRLKKNKMILFGALLASFTFYLMSRADMTQDNLTYVANVLNYRIAVFLWSIFSASFFFISTRKLYKSVHLNHSIFLVLHILLALMLVSSSLIPYDLEQSPLLSSLHVDISSISVILYILYLLIYLFQLSRFDFLRFTKALMYLTSILVLAILIFVTYGKINGFMELVLMVGLIGYTLYLLYK